MLFSRRRVRSDKATRQGWGSDESPPKERSRRQLPPRHRVLRTTPWRDHRQQSRSPTIGHEYDPLECVPNHLNERTDCVIGRKIEKRVLSSLAPHACYAAIIAAVIVLTAAANSQRSRKSLVCRSVSWAGATAECHS